MNRLRENSAMPMNRLPVLNAMTSVSSVGGLGPNQMGVASSAQPDIRAANNSHEIAIYARNIMYVMAMASRGRLNIAELRMLIPPKPSIVITVAMNPTSTR